MREGIWTTLFAYICVMNITFAVDVIAERLRKLLEKKEKVIIAIEGYSGSGKTTLLEALVSQCSYIVPVHRDDFLHPRDEVRSLFHQAKDRAKFLQYSATDLSKLKDVLMCYKQGQDSYSTQGYNSVTGVLDVPIEYDFSARVLVLEGIFIAHSQALQELFDCTIFLNIDLNTADGRRRKREMEKWGSDYFPDTHPDCYFKFIREGYQKYLDKYQPEKHADIVLDL